MIEGPSSSSSSSSSTLRPPLGAMIVNGYQVRFPHGKKAFPAQLSVISKALSALSTGGNALLESPTGTGKTLALLVSALSWQKKEFDLSVTKYEQECVEKKCPDKSDDIDKPDTSNDKKKCHSVEPRRKTVFFCSRTHSQLQQVRLSLISLYTYFPTFQLPLNFLI